MKVNFNPAFKYNSNFSDFIKPSDENQMLYTSMPKKDEIIIAKTKKAVSECKYVVIALGILYFAMKKNFKVNRIKNEAKKAAELAKMKVPQPKLIKINPEQVLNF